MKNIPHLRKILALGFVMFFCLLIKGHSAFAVNLTSSTGGDGYTPILYTTTSGENRIFTIYHHLKPSGTTTPNFNINCVSVETGGICSGYPKYFNSTAGTDNTGVNDIATSYYPHYVTVGSKVYYAAQRTSDNGIGCFDMEANTNCGYFQLGTLPMTSNTTRPAAVDGIEEVGTKLYSIGSDVQMYCYDLNTQAACVGQPYPANTGDRAMPPYNGTDFRSPHELIGTNIYFVVNYWSQTSPNNARLTCFDTVTNDRCAGWLSSVSLPNTNTGVHEGIGSVFASYDMTAVANAVCIAGYAPDGPSCFDLTTAAVATPPSGLLSGLPAAYAREETRLGNKTYFAFYQSPGGYAVCYDFTTQANCSGFTSPMTWPAVNGGDTSDYGYTYSSLGCFFATGDAKILWSFNAATGATGDASCPTASPPSGSGASGNPKAPGTPDTGFALIKSHPLFTLIVTTLLAATIVYIARHNKQLSTKK